MLVSHAILTESDNKSTVLCCACAVSANIACADATCADAARADAACAATTILTPAVEAYVEVAGVCISGAGAGVIAGTGRRSLGSLQGLWALPGNWLRLLAVPGAQMTQSLWVYASAVRLQISEAVFRRSTCGVTPGGAHGDVLTQGPHRDDLTWGSRRDVLTWGRWCAVLAFW